MRRRRRSLRAPWRAERRVQLGHRALEREPPCSTSCIAATADTALVIDAIPKTVSGVMAARAVEPAQAERALVQHAPVGRRHRDDAGHFLLHQPPASAARRCGRHGRPGREPGGAARHGLPRQRRRWRAVPFNMSRRLYGDVMGRPPSAGYAPAPIQCQDAVRRFQHLRALSVNQDVGGASGAL